MNGTRVLIVEDELLIAESLKEQLEEFGVDVLDIFTTGGECLKFFDENDADLVLMDIRLEGKLSGIETACRLWENSRIPVVFITSHSDRETLDRAKEAHPVGYLLKPFESTSLYVALDMAFHKHHVEEQLRKSEQQLYQAQKMESIGRLAGGVAHDVNNMMTVVIGFADVVRKRLGVDHPLSEMVDQIRQAGSRSANIARQLLAFSRKQVLTPEVVDLNSIVRDSLQLLQRLIGAEIRTKMSLTEVACPVEIDRTQLEQVLLNLAANARDAMPDGGEFSIHSHILDVTPASFSNSPEILPGRYVSLIVRDTGCGMDEETRSHLFEPFFTTKRLGEGTGLGMATVYGIVKQSEGHILVSSAPGMGTTFTILFPSAEEEHTPTVEPSPMCPRGTETVLVVEDEESVRILTSRVLQDHGYRVLEAYNGAEALEVARYYPAPIDLLLTDAVMPEMRGLEVAEHLTRQRAGLRVLFMSGYTEDNMQSWENLPDSTNFLSKPFDIVTLLTKVREVLDAEEQELGECVAKSASRGR